MPFVIFQSQRVTCGFWDIFGMAINGSKDFYPLGYEPLPSFLIYLPRVSTGYLLEIDGKTLFTTWTIFLLFWLQMSKQIFMRPSSFIFAKSKE